MTKPEAQRRIIENNRRLAEFERQKKERWARLQPVWEGPIPRVTLFDLQTSYIDAVVQECGGNQTLAAEWLGVSRVTLWRWLHSPTLATVTRGLKQ